MIGRLATYDVCGVIGLGSTGVVVKAFDRQLNRYVAIKMLAPSYSQNGCSRRRFEREAQAVASIKNPHVVPIHMVGEFNGIPYIVMQYLPQGSLSQFIQNHGPLSTLEVTRIGMQVAKALDAAHQVGIIHRDVKPGNVLLEKGAASAMVTDFGLARVVDEATVTRSNSISGTPQYMSPEQARGEGLDSRSDLFSLGSLMYAACTGHPPFTSRSVFGVIRKVCETRPHPIQELNPDIDDWLVAFIQRLHSPRPGKRFQTAGQVAELLALELAHKQSPTLVTKPPRDWWSKAGRKSGVWKTFVAVSAALIVSVALFLFANGNWIQQGSKSRPSNRLEIQRDTKTGSERVRPPRKGTENRAHVPVADLPTTQEHDSKSRSRDTSSPDELENLNRPEKQIANDATELVREFDSPQKNPGHVFSRVYQRTFDAREILELQTNLGAIEILSHDKTTVELKVVHQATVADAATAELLFDELMINGSDPASVDSFVAANRNSNQVKLEFATRALRNSDVNEIDDLELLKRQLKIHNNRNRQNVRIELAVPRQSHLKIKTTFGPIDLTSIDGNVELETHYGHIEVGDVAGNARLTTYGGHITAGDVGGDAKFKTNTGNIRGNAISGSAEAATGTGHIEFGKIAGPANLTAGGGTLKIREACRQVEAITGSGAISVCFVDQPQRDSTISTDCGTIDLGLLSDLAVNIHGTCKGGQILAPFISGSQQQVDRKLNGGGERINVSAKYGSVRIRVTEKES